MVKVLLKKNEADAGFLAKVSDQVLASQHVLHFEGDTYVRSHVPWALRLCGSCRHRKPGSSREPDAGGGYCEVDSKDTAGGGTCRNGGFVPEVVVYRKVKQITVELAPEVGVVGEPAAYEVTAISARRRLGRPAYAAAFLFFAAAFMATLWVLQRINN